MQIEEFVSYLFHSIPVISASYCYSASYGGWSHTAMGYNFLKSYSIWLEGNLNVILPELCWSYFKFTRLSGYHFLHVDLSAWCMHQLHEANLIQLEKVIYFKEGNTFQWILQSPVSQFGPTLFTQVFLDWQVTKVIHTQFTYLLQHKKSQVKAAELQFPSYHHQVL